MGATVVTDQIARLSQWARVAFATRCAARLQPFTVLPEFVPDNTKHQKIVTEAQELAQRLAEAGGVPPEPDAATWEFAESMRASSSPFEQAMRWAKKQAADCPADAHVYRAAASAYGAAAGYLLAASDAYVHAKREYPDPRAFESFIECANACGCHDDAEAASEVDLLWLGRRLFDDEDPVPETFFGRALWPDGEPQDWRYSRKRLVELLELPERFRSLANMWRNDTRTTSSVTEMAMHPAYQRIVGFGRDALPFLVRELAESSEHWFWALKSITGANPVTPEDRGRIDSMAEAWLLWAKENEINGNAS